MTAIRDAWDVLIGAKQVAPEPEKPFVGLELWFDDETSRRRINEGEELTIRYSDGAVTGFVGERWVFSSPWAITLNLEPCSSDFNDKCEICGELLTTPHTHGDVVVSGNAMRKRPSMLPPEKQ